MASSIAIKISDSIYLVFLFDLILIIRLQTIKKFLEVHAV